MVRKWFAALIASAVVLTGVAGFAVPAGAQPPPGAKPAWCPTVPPLAIGYVDWWGAFDWPDAVVTRDEWLSCGRQVRSAQNTRYTLFDIGNSLECQLVVTEGSWIAEAREDASFLDRLGSHLRERLPAFMYDTLESWLGGPFMASDGTGLFGGTCWVPPAFDEALWDSFNVRTDPSPTAQYSPGCRGPDWTNNPYWWTPYLTSWDDCLFWSEKQGDQIVRIHWVGTMLQHEAIKGCTEGTPEGCVVGLSMQGLDGYGPLPNGNPGGITKFRLNDAEVEVGIADDWETLLPNTPPVPPFVDQSKVARCQLFRTVGDDITAVTWSGGETFDFTVEYAPGVTRTDTTMAFLTVNLGETADGQAVKVETAGTVPGPFSITVPELSSPLTPSVDVQVFTGDCQGRIWYDPTGEGGPPSSNSGRMSFEECIDTEAGGLMPEPDGAFDGALFTLAKWVICGVYSLFVPSHGFSWWVASAAINGRGGALGDLVAIWQSGARVVQQVRSSATSSTSAAQFTIGSSVVTIPAPECTLRSLLTVCLSIVVLLGAGLRGVRMVLSAWSGSPLASTGDSSQHWEKGGTWTDTDGGASWSLNDDEGDR